MNFCLAIQSINFRSVEKEWWKTTDFLQRSVKMIHGSRFLSGTKYAGPLHGRLKSFNSLDDLVRLSMDWRAGINVVANGASEPRLRLILGNGSLDVLLTPVAGGSAEETVERLIELSVRVHDDFGEEAFFGPWFGIRVVDEMYTRPKPPRSNPRWMIGNVVDLFSQAFYQQGAQADKEAFETLATAPLPPDATRQLRNGLLIIRWARDYATSNEVAAARARQEGWLAKVLRFPIEDGYNELGDRRVTVVSKVELPPFTFYDEASGYAFSTVVLEGGRIPDVQAIERLEAIASEGRTRNPPINAIYLLTASREDALAASRQLRDSSKLHFAYVGNDRSPWEPEPQSRATG